MATNKKAVKNNTQTWKGLTGISNCVFDLEISTTDIDDDQGDASVCMLRKQKKRRDGVRGGDDGAPVVVVVAVVLVFYSTLLYSSSSSSVLLYFSRGRRWCPRASTGGEGLAAAAMLLQRSTSRSIPTLLLR